MKDIHNVIFIDIETAPSVKNFTDLDKSWQEQFLKRFESQRKPKIISVSINSTNNTWQTDQELWDAHAPLYAEFNKVKAIAIGIMPPATPKPTDYPGAIIKINYDEDEVALLRTFDSSLRKIEAGVGGVSHFIFPALAAHNGKGFDFPILARKFIMHGLQLPHQLLIAGKKPWEVNLVDTQEMWAMGEYRHPISLVRLAMTLGIPFTKELEGLNPIEFYYKHGLQRLAIYCANDIPPLVNIYRRIHGLQPLTNWQVFDGQVGKLIDRVVTDNGEQPVSVDVPHLAPRGVSNVSADSADGTGDAGSTAGGENKEALSSEGAGQQYIDLGSAGQTEANLKNFNIADQEQCPSCFGTGENPIEKIVCRICGGNGFIPKMFAPATTNIFDRRRKATKPKPPLQ